MHAPPDTLLGMMQRGHGRTLARATQEPQAATEFTIDCITHDPRWDHQVEERAWLYATLITNLRIELPRLRAAYDTPADPCGDTDAWLVTAVLGLLATKGVEGSVSELRYYLRTGRDVNQAMSALLPHIDHPEAEEMRTDLMDFASAETANRTRVPAAPRITRADRDRQARVRVLSAAAKTNLKASVSIDEFDDAQWERVLLQCAPTFLRGEDFPLVLRIAVRRCIRQLRSPSARVWAKDHADLDSPVGDVALSLLADLSEPADGPMLFELLSAAMERGDDYMYHQCSLVDGIARARYLPAVETVDEIFDNTVYSYLRTKCASALSGLAQDFATGRAIECLDDCESRTRAIGIAHADLSKAVVRERLGRIVNDPTEDQDNRRAAADQMRSAAKLAAATKLSP